MSPLYVIALPAFADADAAWIEAVRTSRDPQAGLIGAHATFVFAAIDVPEADLTDHVAAVAASHPPVSAVWRRVLPWTDQRGHFAFLMPEAGFAALCRLRDALHTGPLAARKPGSDVFLPHVTLARVGDAVTLMTLCDTLNAEDRTMPGAVGALAVVARDGTALRSIAAVPLRGRV